MSSLPGNLVVEGKLLGFVYTDTNDSIYMMGSEYVPDYLDYVDTPGCMVYSDETECSQYYVPSEAAQAGDIYTSIGISLNPDPDELEFPVYVSGSGQDLSILLGLYLSRSADTEAQPELGLEETLSVQFEHKDLLGYATSSDGLLIANIDLLSLCKKEYEHSSNQIWIHSDSLDFRAGVWIDTGDVDQKFSIYGYHDNFQKIVAISLESCAR